MSAVYRLFHPLPSLQVSVINLFVSLPPFLLFMPHYFCGAYFYAERIILSSIVIWWSVVALAVLQMTLPSFYNLHVVSGSDSVSKTWRGK